LQCRSNFKVFKAIVCKISFLSLHRLKATTECNFSFFALLQSIYTSYRISKAEFEDSRVVKRDSKWFRCLRTYRSRLVPFINVYWVNFVLFFCFVKLANCSNLCLSKFTLFALFSPVKRPRVIDSNNESVRIFSYKILVFIVKFHQLAVVF
jgi:hypothetical protein